MIFFSLWGSIRYGTAGLVVTHILFARSIHLSQLKYFELWISSSPSIATVVEIRFEVKSITWVWLAILFFVLLNSSVNSIKSNSCRTTEWNNKGNGPEASCIYFLWGEIKINECRTSYTWNTPIFLHLNSIPLVDFFQTYSFHVPLLCSVHMVIFEVTKACCHFPFIADDTK